MFGTGPNLPQDEDARTDEDRQRSHPNYQLSNRVIQKLHHNCTATRTRWAPPCSANGMVFLIMPVGPLQVQDCQASVTAVNDPGTSVPLGVKGATRQSGSVGQTVLDVKGVRPIH